MQRLLAAHTWLLSVYVISAVIIVVYDWLDRVLVTNLAAVGPRARA
jgi:hypothetical protein